MSQADGHDTGDEAQKLLDVVFGEYRPNQVGLVWTRDGRPPTSHYWQVAHP